MMVAGGFIFAPLSPRTRIIGALVVGGVVLAQVLAEGTRWQMVPVYVVAVILMALITFFPQPGRAWTKVTLCIVTALVTGLSAIPAWIVPVFRLPTPSGQYGIGTVTYHWTDSTRRELFSADPSVSRQIVAQVWYPGTTITVRGEPYVADSRTLSANLTRLLSATGWVKVPSFALSHFSLVRTHAAAGSPPADGAFPVLIFASGLSGFRQSNMAQVEALVSNGFVVVGLDQPYASASATLAGGTTIPGLEKPQMQPYIDQSLEPAPDPPVLNGTVLDAGIIGYLADDLRFALDQLTALNESDPVLQGHLDIARAGAFGISLGSMETAQACHDDPRLKACLMMDAAMPADVAADGLTQPSLWITRPASDMRLERERSGGWTEHDIDQLFSSMQSAQSRSTAWTDISYIPGMFHTDFTDVPYYLRFGTQLGITGPAGPSGNQQLTKLCVEFFRGHL